MLVALRGEESVELPGVVVGELPAFILRRQHQEDEQRGGAEHQHGRRALLLLLEGELGPLEADARRQDLARQLLHPVQRRAGGDARRGDALHLGGGEEIVARHAIGPSVSWRICATVPIGTISPAALRAFRRGDVLGRRRNWPSAWAMTS